VADARDAVVIGGGHNGLIAGAYLAKAGARTVVLEARSKVGGCTDTSSPWPEHQDFKVTTYSYVVSLMPPAIVRELGLARHGYKLHPLGPYYQAFPDGRSISLTPGDAKATYESVARFSRKDADTLEHLDEWLEGIARFVKPLLESIPPNLGSTSPGDLTDTFRAAWRARGLGARGVADLTRLFTMSVTDFLDRWFESEEVKAAFTVNGVIGSYTGPDAPGTAYILLHHSIGDAGGGLGSWGFPEGGMGAVADACRRAAESLGCEVRTDAKVAKILVRGGRAVGVALSSGQEIRAPVVVSAVHPKVGFLDLVDRAELPPAFVDDIEHLRGRSGAVKINLAISRLPSFTADPGSDLAEHHTGSIEMCLSTDYAERAFQDAKSGRPSEDPVCDGCIPTTLDPTLMPEGVHLFSMAAMHVPCEWHEEPHREEMEAFADSMIECYDELAPGLKDSVIARQVVSLYDMEQELALPGAAVFHADLTPDQLFHMRPAPGYADYRTPIRGLYHASAGSAGGGGVTGIPARNCVRQIRHDRLLPRRARAASR
jgi:phytoene dehydrogenase-like protein